ncbi:type III-B CRISPR module RAMP protein Cmr4 [Paenibacillus doosanensis]|uniref:type III-B CRISPR module RAMP protein Cmr4 n=1 Tax=Paenibacillus doosanensis TaxID=1229154 RepID=UPI00217F5AF7|nr:type III-B CRISPR module RAMP protein Cmr4 [Paenibacillus doosanensis]MCS7459007.1 type III-B CRISPR module RAMP protein Cmr4 [Paenibacillus doosanensis]
MYKQSMALFFHVLTSMHAGGDSQLGVIDLPIQREGHTRFPKVEASSLKGSLRRAVEQQAAKSEVARFFGPTDQGELYASALSFSDARLLFFPVRSVKGVFAWVTCPFVLQRFIDDMKLVNIHDFILPKIDGAPLVAKSSKIVDDDKVMLEEYVFTVNEEKDGGFTIFLNQLLQKLPASELIYQYLISHAIIVSDDDFADFVQLSTEVVTRIRIDDETGTVDGTGLFNEEYLPSESILYSLVFVSDEHAPSSLQREAGKADNIVKIIKSWIPETFQIGANLTLGKGFVSVKMISGGDTHAKAD